MTLVEEVELRRVKEGQRLDPARRVEHGQFFTPAPIGEFIASLFDIRPGVSRLLDPGAGVGSLTVAFESRWAAESVDSLEITAVELDDSLQKPLALAMGLHSGRVPGRTIVHGDFIEWAADALTGLFANEPPTFDYIITNPPYRKLNTDSRHRRLVQHVGVEVTNLYAAFVSLAVRLLAPGGQLVAITPRSFMNGPYFRAFRRDLLAHAAIRQIHVYDSRCAAFADSNVLQENVIFKIERGGDRTPVVVSSSPHPGSAEIRARTVPADEVVRPGDPNSFIHLSSSDTDASTADFVASQPHTLASLGLAVSTGKVVDFRSRDALRSEPGADTAPLVYPTHLNHGRIGWPKAGRKPNAIEIGDHTKNMMVPAGHYVLIKRFSSKEERRRIVAAVATPDDLPGDWWGIENHLNVVHCRGAGLDADLALGLAVWLNSTVVDVAFRQFSGHTQVNATDLRSMHFPSALALVRLGQAAGVPFVDQDKVDALVTEHVGAPHG